MNKIITSFVRLILLVVSLGILACSAYGFFQADPSLGNATSPEQDSLYYRAMEIDLPTDVRLRMDLRESEYNPQMLQEARSIMAAYINVMDLPSSLFVPDPREKVQRREMLVDALSVPGQGMYNYDDRFRLFYLEDAAQFLGIAEDLGPTISYRLDVPTDVEIVVYSIQAKVIATLFTGKQPAGPHQITWNLRNSNGMPMPSGDYIGEVRIGNDRYVRKRIQIK
jgi:hypothetical protein